MKTLGLFVLVLVGCLPEWRGPVPPVVPRHDPCGSGALTDEGQRTLTRTPYLQSAQTDAVTVAWAGPSTLPMQVVVASATDQLRTPIVNAPARLEAPDLGDQNPDDYNVYADDDEGGEPLAPAVAKHRDVVAARVAGLRDPDGYCYRIETGGRPLTTWASLTLAPREDNDRTDRFVILGDTGNGQPAQRAIGNRIANESMDAVIFLGDIAYTAGTDAELQDRFFEIYADLFRHVPVYAAIGNHDNRTEHGRPFEEAFLLPGNERWYSFDLGDVHFVTLDTMRIGREQAEWLDADLAKTKQKFIVTLGHHPPYTSDRRGGNKEFQKWFVPILERHHVELVLSGHEHQYERTKMLHGIVYIVSGGGGGRLDRTGRNKQQQVAFAKHHYLTLEAHADKLLVRAIGIDDKQLDEVEIADRRGPAGSAVVDRVAARQR